MALRDDYTVDPGSGLISSPGKFEGERPEVVDAYEQYLDGFCIDDGYSVTVELRSGEKVSFREDDQGFIHEVTAKRTRARGGN